MPRELLNYADALLQRQVFAEADGTISTVLRQRNRDAVMMEIERRRHGPPQRRMDWGRCVLSIPVLDLERIKDRYPELRAPDAETRNRAWAKFIASSESTPYKVK